MEEKICVQSSNSKNNETDKINPEQTKETSEIIKDNKTDKGKKQKCTPPENIIKTNQEKGTINKGKEPINRLSDNLIKMMQEKMKITMLKPFSRGGFSEVYDGRFNKINLAIKIMMRKTNNTEESKERTKKWLEQAKKEGNVGSNLLHKNIISTIRHGGYHEESLYYYIIVMEKAINIDLNKLIQSHINPTFYKTFFGFDQLSDNFCRFFLLQCLNVAFYFHICHLVHLDLKPENYLLHKDFVVKLADFSLVTKIPKGDFTFQNYSTPSYMAPEFVLNKTVEKEEAHKADLYSIGITLLYMKCHQRLIPKNSVIDKTMVEFAKEKKKDLIKTSLENGTLNKECGDFIQLLTKEKYNERPNIFQALDNEWVNMNKKLIRFVQQYNEGELLKYCLELQKSDFYISIKQLNSFKKNKYKFKRNLI